MSADAGKWKHYPKEPAVPKGAPNVLLILTDDVGYGAASTFGGPTPTPAFDALAETGLRYNSFYTTAMCSPTRASLLTGRNHHAVASGVISDVSIDEEGYTSVIPKSAATIGRVLKENGYDTAFIGKNHNTPFWENSPVGPFDHWPNAWGFDYYYGFNAPYVDQFNPDLNENRNQVRPPADPDYHLDKDLADHLINWLQTQQTLRPGHPFFAYFASGSTHAPHQAPREWVERFKGQFDQGWDRLREETFERQKEMGIIPADAVLTERMEGLPAWDSLAPKVKQLFSRKMEVAGAMLAHFDYQIGRIVEQLEKSGQLDNTMIIYIQGDNGASIENLTGSTQVERVAQMDDSELEAEMNEQGGPEVFGAYPAAWGWATNAPFRWGKQIASHLGGLRDGMVISWPAGIKAHGEMRTQFGHVIDIAPTIYEAAGITPPATIDGVEQQSIDGTSLVYSFDDPDAPEQHREQYFEMLGNRAYYKDGWMASTTPGRAPWERTAPDPLEFPWELYDLNTDFSQAKDVAAAFPEKLAELQAAFDTAARRFHVYPLSANLYARIVPSLRPNLVDGHTSFTYYPGDARYIAGYSFPVVGPGWTISASVSITGSRAQGPILTQGDHYDGHGLLLEEGRPTYIYNPSGKPEHVVKLQGEAALDSGWHTLVIAYKSGDEEAVEIELMVDGQRVAGASVPGPLRVGFIPGRGIVYIGRSCIPPFLPRWALPESRFCQIGSVKIEKVADA